MVFEMGERGGVLSKLEFYVTPIIMKSKLHKLM
jgi:hypothetical protein